MKSILTNYTLMRRSAWFAVLLLAACRSRGATIAATAPNLTQAELDQASGATLALGAGTYTVSAPLNVHSGTTITGAPGFASHVVGTLAQGQYLFNIDPNSSAITIAGLDIVSSGGVVGIWTGTLSGLHITGNRIQSTGGGTAADGGPINGIDIRTASDDTEICWNYFHDSPGIARNWQINNPSDGHFDHNEFYNVNDGGHVYAPNQTTCSWNYGHHLGRMGQECQSWGAAGENDGANFVCDHDVFFDYINPWYNSEAISFCTTASTNDHLTNCYFGGTMIGNTWGPAAGGVNRFGYAFEAMAPNLDVSGNTIVAPNATFAGIGAGMAIVARNNNIYGAANCIYGALGGDVGPGGAPGSYQAGAALQNTIVNDLAGAPVPPANTFAGPQFANGSTPPATAPALTATSPSAGVVDLSWPTPLPSAMPLTITATGDGSAQGTLTIPAGAMSATVDNAHDGWGLLFSLNGATTTVLVAGDWSLPYVGVPVLAGPETQPSQPASQPTTAPAPVELQQIRLYSNGTYSSTQP